MKLNLAANQWLKYDGYGGMAYGVAQALIRSGHQMYPVELDQRISKKPAWFYRAQGLDFSHVTVQLAPPNCWWSVPGRSVGWTMHESMTLPPKWAEYINKNSQWCIVPSGWLIPVFEEAGVKVPMAIVPGGINPDECPVLGQNHYRPYTFGALADRGGRKGHQKVEMAFYKAFDWKNKDVALLIKCRPESRPRQLDWSYAPDSRYTYWSSDLESMTDFYAQIDAYICPAKCEGYGMSQREAAACGLPVVVQRFSGTADNCDKWAIPLENYKLTESSMEGSGGLWAEPSLDELVETMRYLYLHQDDAKAKALKAAQWMRDNETYAHSANKLVKTLNEWLGGPVPIDETPQGKIGDIHVITKIVEPIYEPIRSSSASSNGIKHRLTI